MDAGEPQYLFRETRLNLEPPAPSLVVTIRVPSGGRVQRRDAHDGPTEDEAIFRLKHLATASSVYHRKWHDSPRSFLWRILDDGRLLSIRAVDVGRKDKSQDALLVLNFHFSVPIQPACVAFADPKEHDALSVFVLDRKSQLYTFTLRPDLFQNRNAIDATLSELCKVQSPAGLGFKSAHRLVAITADSLLVAVNDGGIIRLDRERLEDASGENWKETFFNVQGWAQNLRSLLPFQGKRMIRYGKINMETSVATSIQVTSFGLKEGLFAITVCLDHRMRIWNVDDGYILYSGDILAVERSQQQAEKWSIDPSQSNLVQVAGKSRGQRICVTYSPVGLGEFKFWKIIAKNPHTVVVEDMFPKTTLLSQTPSSSDIWTLADFVVSSPAEDFVDIWVLWKNNMTYRVQCLKVEKKNVAKTWEDVWDGVYPATFPDPAPMSSPCDATDTTEQWLQAILSPGTFTKATLETALSIYERGLGSPKDGSKGRGLADSICSVLGATATLDRGSSGAMDYQQFRSSSETQWRRFYRLLIELDRQRGEAFGLAMDGTSGMVWVVCADLLSAVTECDSLERLYYNYPAPDDDQDQESVLISTASTFLEGLTDNYIQLCNSVLRQEMFGDSSKTDLERIQFFSDKAAFWRGITDDDCAQVADALGPNFDAVSDDLYGSILDLMNVAQEKSRRHLRHPLTEFGKRLILKGVQDRIKLQWDIFFSLLVLLVHMEFEFDSEEEALHNRVNVGAIFRRLVSTLRRLELLRWLTRTQLSVPVPGVVDMGLLPSTMSRKGAEESREVTVLEASVGHLLGLGSIKSSESVSAGIADLVSDLCASDGGIELSPTRIQCFLIKHGRADLAFGLAPFCDQSPFSSYVQGRVLLALKDYESAAINFRRAAIGMGSEDTKAGSDSAGLLDDGERKLFHSGQARYYFHIVGLYEDHRAYSYVLEFARLASQFVGFAKGNTAALKSDILSRLFNAALATSQFGLAHTSLLSIKDDAVRQSSLRKLVDRMCETHHNKELVALPFPGMQLEVEAILAQRCRNGADAVRGFPYHQVLYSWRIQRDDHRGAASVLLDRIHRLKQAGEGDNFTGDVDLLDTPVTRQYLLLINALSCVDLKQAWVFDEGELGGRQDGDVAGKRKLVTLADIRKQYQDELDRIAAIQNNQFGFETDDAMEIG